MGHREDSQFQIENYDWKVSGSTAHVSYFGRRTLDIPSESLGPFIQDLTLDYADLPLSGVREIDEIIEGRAQFLGKGFEGIAFKVGNKTVKLSTTVPFHPAYQKHRTPAQARKMALKEAQLLQDLRDTVGCFPSVTVYEHAERLWVIKPYLKLVEPEKLTERQVLDLENCIHALHAAGIAICDTLQFGLLRDKVYFFDVGQACEATDSAKAEDLANLRYVAKQAGVTLKEDTLLEDEVVRDFKYLLFLRKARAIQSKLDEMKEKLHRKFYALPLAAQRRHEDIEDFLWES